MRILTLRTETGRSRELKFEPTDAWGGFGFILEQAADLIKEDPEAGWVVAEETGCETKMFRDFFKSRGLL